VLGDRRSYAMVLRYAHLAPSHAAEAAQRVAQWEKIGGAEGDRTLDLRIANATLNRKINRLFRSWRVIKGLKRR